jgi:hypothetical protein
MIVTELSELMEPSSMVATIVSGTKCAKARGDLRLMGRRMLKPAEPEGENLEPSVEGADKLFRATLNKPLN